MKETKILLENHITSLKYIFNWFCSRVRYLFIYMFSYCISFKLKLPEKVSIVFQQLFNYCIKMLHELLVMKSLVFK